MVISDIVGATLVSLIPRVMTVYELLSNGWSSVLVRLAIHTCGWVLRMVARDRAIFAKEECVIPWVLSWWNFVELS